MAKGRRRFERPLGELRYRKLFLISVEGSKTEPQYFGVLNKLTSTVIKVTCVPGSTDSAPSRVLKRMRDQLRKEGLRAEDEAWLVVDRDAWPEAQLDELAAWAGAAPGRGFALSNPKFEFWLLLHFESGDGATSAQRCEARLRQHLPRYDKGVTQRDLTPERLKEAIARARRRDTPLCAGWPRTEGITTVYRLVERILAEETQLALTTGDMSSRP